MPVHQRVRVRKALQKKKLFRSVPAEALVIAE